MDTDEVEVFYGKLFRALEVGRAKADETLVVDLFWAFSAPPAGRSDAAAAWFARRVQPEQVMGWLLARTRPFAEMLHEIYERLSEVRATVGGNVEEISFDFGRLAEHVDFPLDAFPATYVMGWRDVSLLTRGFHPGARGRVRIDTPNYWWNDMPALPRLVDEPVLRPEVFERLPRPNQLAVHERVKHAVTVLEAHWSAVELPAERASRLRPDGDRAVLVADPQEWQDVLREVRGIGADRGFVETDAGVRDAERVLAERGRLVEATGLYALLDHAQQLGLHSPDGVAPRPVIGPDPESDDTYAFLSAYDLVFPRVITPDQVWDEIVDRVLLPFWRHRWRLFEVWSILWLIRSMPEHRRPALLLSPREDRTDAYAWQLAGGNACAPVARIDLPSRSLSVHYQYRSPLSPADAAEFRQKHIEPDVRLRERRGDRESDLVILELKDRYRARGSAEKRVAQMYATSGAPVVCVANHSPFGAAALHSRVHTERYRTTMTYLVDEFGPGSALEPITEAVGLAVDPPIDALVDASPSIRPESVATTLDLLGDVVDGRRFEWKARITLASDGTALRAVEGWPELSTALCVHRQVHARRRAVIITDGAGRRQFADLVAAGHVDGSDYHCVDVTRTISVAVVVAWSDS